MPSLEPVTGSNPPNLLNPTHVSELVHSEPLARASGIEVDPARRRVRVEGREVELTDQEFRLLYLLVSNPGIVFTRPALLAAIWRGNTFVTARSVDTLVKRLRRRIEPDTANPKFLITIWGVGYKLAEA